MWSRSFAERTIRIGRLAHLHEDIRCLRGAAEVWVGRVECAIVVALDGVPGDHGIHGLLRKLSYRGNLVRRAPTVEEVDNRQGCLQSDDVRHTCEVLRFLHGVGVHHDAVGLPGRHHLSAHSKD